MAHEAGNYENKINTNSGLGQKIGIGAALAIAVGGLWYQGSELSSVRGELSRTQQHISEVQGQVQTTGSDAAAKIEAATAQFNDSVEQARKDAMAGVSRTQQSVKTQTGKLMATIAEKNQALAQQLDDVRKDSDTKSSQVNEALSGIKGDVGTVRTDLDTTKSGLDEANNTLKRFDGDMGGMNGRIATNATELAALRRLGERDYYEFKIAKSKSPQKVGDIALALTRVDTKRNKFTVDVVADDKRIEKKDKTVNEPVQFFRQGSKTPYEVVVNQVDKNQIVGYLSVPKGTSPSGR